MSTTTAESLADLRNFIQNSNVVLSSNIEQIVDEFHRQIDDPSHWNRSSHRIYDEEDGGWLYEHRERRDGFRIFFLGGNNVILSGAVNLAETLYRLGAVSILIVGGQTAVKYLETTETDYSTVYAPTYICLSITNEVMTPNILIHGAPLIVPSNTSVADIDCEKYCDDNSIDHVSAYIAKVAHEHGTQFGALLYATRISGEAGYIPGIDASIIKKRNIEAARILVTWCNNQKK